MDPRLSAQDVLRCDPCGTPVPPSYCVYCHVNLCEACAKDHLSDESKEHKVLSIEQRAFTPHYDKDANNVTTQSDKEAHKKVEKFESNKEIKQEKIEMLKRQMDEIENIINLWKALAEFRESIFILNECNKLEAHLQMIQRLERERDEMLVQSRKSYYKDILLDFFKVIFHFFNNFLLFIGEKSTYEIALGIFSFSLFLYLSLFIGCLFHYI